MAVILPPWLLLDTYLLRWLEEDIGRGDRTTQSLFANRAVPTGKASLTLKENGLIAGLPLVQRVFYLLNNQVVTTSVIKEGGLGSIGETIAFIEGPLDTLLIGERLALNILMRLSGIATLTYQYSQLIADLPTTLVDTRKTTPGLRALEKYAIQMGGGKNHRFGLDDAVMIKDNHIKAAGSITQAIAQVRAHSPYPLAIEVETTSFVEAEEAMTQGADIIMLDNMPVAEMEVVVKHIRQFDPRIKIEASGNINFGTLRSVANTGVDYISTSATITRASWLDISMNITT